jgi:hypothetical protein
MLNKILAVAIIFTWLAADAAFPAEGKTADDPAGDVLVDEAQDIVIQRKNGTQGRGQLVVLTTEELRFKQAGGKTVLKYSARDANIRAILLASGDYYAVNPKTGKFDRYDPMTNLFGRAPSKDNPPPDKDKLTEADKARMEAEKAKLEAEKAKLEPEKAKAETERARRDAAKAKEAAERAAEQARRDAEKSREKARPTSIPASSTPQSTGQNNLSEADESARTKVSTPKPALAGQVEVWSNGLAIGLIASGSFLLLLGLLGCAVHFHRFRLGSEHATRVHP